MVDRLLRFGGRALFRPWVSSDAPMFSVVRILSSDSSSGRPPGIHIPKPLVKEKRQLKIFPSAETQKEENKYGKEVAEASGHPAGHPSDPGPPVTLDSMPQPFRKYDVAFKQLQSKFNKYIAFAIALLAASFLLAIKNDSFIVDALRAPESYRKRKKHASTKPPTEEDAAAAASPAPAAAAESEEPATPAANFAPAAARDVSEVTSQTHAADEPMALASPPDLDEPAKQALTKESSAMPIVVDKVTSDGPKEARAPRSEMAGSAAEKPSRQRVRQVYPVIPEEIPYLLIGAGTAAYYAALAIRARDPDAKVLMIGEEQQLPYSRPPLSKELWWYGDDKMAESLEYQGLTGRKKDVYYETQGFYVAPEEISSAVHGGVSLVTGRQVVRLDIPSHTAYLDDGRTVRYQKCLIATGGTPRNLPVMEKAGEKARDKVTLFRTIDDFRKLDEIARGCHSIAIIGGGFLGSELAYSLNRRYAESKGLKVYQIFRERGNVAHVLPEFLSDLTTKELRSCGVNVIAGEEVTDVSVDDRGCVTLRLTSGESILADHVVVAVGIDANTKLAKSSGLEVDQKNGGFIVDAELRARSDVWVAGDASSFYDVKLGRRRVEHWQHAQVTGRLAGENMTGANKPYWHQSSFYSLIAPDAHFQAIGKTDSSMPTVSVFAADDGKMDDRNRGVVFYLDGRVVVGVVLFNVFGSGIDVARRIISDGKEHDDLREVAKLFEIHRNEKEEEDSTSH